MRPLLAVAVCLAIALPLAAAQTEDAALGCGFGWNAVEAGCEEGNVCRLEPTDCTATCLDDVAITSIYTFSELQGTSIGDAKELAPLKIEGEPRWNTAELVGLTFGADAVHRASPASGGNGNTLESLLWDNAELLSGFTVEVWMTPSEESLADNTTRVITSLRPETDESCLQRRFGLLQLDSAIIVDVGPGVEAASTPQGVLNADEPNHIVYSREAASFAVWVNGVKVMENATADFEHPSLSVYSGQFNISVGSDVPLDDAVEPYPLTCYVHPVEALLYSVAYSAGPSSASDVEEQFEQGHLRATVIAGGCGSVPFNVARLIVIAVGATLGLMCCLGGMYVVLNNVKRDRAAARGDVTRSQFLGGGDIEVLDYQGGKKGKSKNKSKSKNKGGGRGYDDGYGDEGGYGDQDDGISTSTGAFSTGTDASFDNGYGGGDGWNPERMAASVGPGRLNAISMLPPEFEAGAPPPPARKQSTKKKPAIVEDSDSSGSEGPLAAARMSGIAGANRANKKPTPRAVNAISMLPPEDDEDRIGKAISMLPPNLDEQSTAGDFDADLGGYDPNRARATIMPPGFGGPAVSGPDRKAAGGGGGGSRETTDGLRLEDYNPDEWGDAITSEGVVSAVPKPVGTTSGDKGFFKERPISALPADPNRPISALPADPNKSRKKSRGRNRGQSNQVEGSRGRRGSDHKADRRKGSDHQQDRRRPSLGRKRSPSRPQNNDTYDLEFAVPAHLAHKLGKGSTQGARGEFDIGGGGGLAPPRRGTEQTGRSPRRGDRSPRRHTEHSPRRSPNRPSSLEFNLPPKALQEAKEARKKKNKSPGRRHGR